MSDQTTADVLNSAADYIEKHGWTQGRMSAPTGEVCASSALHRASRAHGVDYILARPALMDVLGERTFCIFNWNDAEGRTKQEVLDAFRKAAKRALGVTA